MHGSASFRYLRIKAIMSPSGVIFVLLTYSYLINNSLLFYLYCMSQNREGFLSQPVWTSWEKIVLKTNGAIAGKPRDWKAVFHLELGSAVFSIIWGSECIWSMISGTANPMYKIIARKTGFQWSFQDIGGPIGHFGIFNYLNHM